MNLSARPSAASARVKIKYPKFKKKPSKEEKLEKEEEEEDENGEDDADSLASSEAMKSVRSMMMEAIAIVQSPVGSASTCATTVAPVATPMGSSRPRVHRQTPFGSEKSPPLSGRPASPISPGSPRRSGRAAASTIAASAGSDESAQSGEAVEDIIATLRQQADKGFVSESDRKINEIMQRILGRPFLFIPDEEEMEGKKSAIDEEKHDEDDDDDDDDEESRVDDDDARASSIRSYDASGLSTAAESDAAAAAAAAAAEDEEESTMDLKEAWEVIRLPEFVTAEEMLSVTGTAKPVEPLYSTWRQKKEPDEKKESSGERLGIEFLTSWTSSAPEAERIPHSRRYNRLHHFCTSSRDVALPGDLKGVARRSHAGRSARATEEAAVVDPAKKREYVEGARPDRMLSAAGWERRRSLAAKQIMEELTRDEDDDDDVESRASSSSSSPLTLDGMLKTWQFRAHRVFDPSHLSVAGAPPVAIDAPADARLHWSLAPPRMDVRPSVVKEILFPKFNSARERKRKEEEEEEEEILDLDLEFETFEEDPEARFLQGRMILRKCPSMSDLPTLERLPPQHPPRGRRKRRSVSLPNRVFVPEGPLPTKSDFDTLISEIGKQKASLARAAAQREARQMAPPERRPSTGELLRAIPDMYPAPPPPPEKREETEAERWFREKEEKRKEEEKIALEKEEAEAEEARKKKRKAKRVARKWRGKPKTLGARTPSSVAPSFRPLEARQLAGVLDVLRQPPRFIPRSSSAVNLLELAANARRDRIKASNRVRRNSLPKILDFRRFVRDRGQAPGVDVVRRPSRTDDAAFQWAKDLWTVWFAETYPDGIGSPNALRLPEDGEGASRAPSSSTVDTVSVVDSRDRALILQLQGEVTRLSDAIDSASSSRLLRQRAFDFCRRGALLRKLGHARRARDDLDAALSMEPNLVDAYWHRHLLFLLEENPKRAMEDITAIMKLTKTHAGAYRSRAELFKAQGEITLAILDFNQAVKLNPKDSDAYYKRAELNEKRGELRLALEDYGIASRLNPTHSDAIFKYCEFYFNNGNWAQAVAGFTELLKRHPSNASAYVFRGRAFAKMSKWTDAMQNFSSAVHMDPMNAEAFYQRGCLLRKSHPRRSLQDLSVSILLDHGADNYEAYLHRGLLYYEMGRFDEAIHDLEAALQVRPDIAVAHVNLGLIYMKKLGDHRKAVAKFSAAIESEPTYVRAYVCRAEASHYIGELKAALRDMTKAIHMQPATQHLYAQRGQILMKMGDLELASFCVHHAAQVNQNIGSTPQQRAVIQTFLGRGDKALEILAQDTQRAPTAAGFVLLAKNQRKNRQIDAAEKSMSQALDLLRPTSEQEPWPPEAGDICFNHGLILVEQNRLKEAVGSFDRAVSITPRHAEAYYHRGVVRIRLGDKKGVADFNQAIAINPKLFQAFLGRACFYGMTGAPSKAILNCTEALKVQPDSVRAYIVRGSLKYQVRSFAGAVEDFVKAMRIDPSCSLAYFNRAVCFYHMKEYEKALHDYGIVLLSSEKLALKALVNRGLLYLEIFDYQNALFDFQEAVERDPKDPRLLHSLAFCLHRLERLDEAVRTFTKALTLHPLFVEAIVGRGNVYMDFVDERLRRRARVDFERALHINPMYIAARVNLAYSLQVSGRYAQAWRQLTSAIEVDAGFVPALEGRAVVNLQMGDAFAAFHDASKAIKLRPDAELYTNRGVINQFMGDSVAAMADFKRATLLDESYSLAYFNAANLYFHARLFKKAAEFYSICISHNPVDEAAFLNRAITRSLLRDSRGAFNDFHAALRIAPNAAHIYYNRGNLNASMNQYSRAEEDYTSALSIFSDDPLVFKSRGDIRGKLGKPAEAIADYKQALFLQSRIQELGPNRARARAKTELMPAA